MKKTLLSLVMLTALFAFVVTQAQAADTDSIAVTVTLQNITVSVSPGTWAIGTIVAGAVVTEDPCTATNDGNVAEDLTIAVSNSAAWTAGAAAAANVFAMDVGASGGPYNTNIPTIGVSLTSGLAAGNPYSFGLEFNSPTSSTDYTEQAITVTVAASATL